MNRNELPPNQQLIGEQRWPVVGEKSPADPDLPWSITIAGCIHREITVSLDEIRAMKQVERWVDVHCVTRWSKLQMKFGGVPLVALLERFCGEPPWTVDAKFVSFVARSERSHSTSLPLREAMRLDPMVVLTAEGEPLTVEHGGPVRVVVPGKYFYKSVKWIERIEFLAEDRLGYWEADAGYHNSADPWKEERYIAATVSKQEATRLIQSRDFSQRNLLSLDARDRDLEDLNAEQSQLRNSDFRGANLQRAIFRRANLSNARLDSADLRNADFSGADLEGASFAGADLRGADLSGASLFGASFCECGSDDSAKIMSRFDSKTRIDESSLAALTEQQRNFVRESLA